MFDLLKFNNVNLDILTETFYTHFYGDYLVKWGEYCVTAEHVNGEMEGYILGKVEGAKDSESDKNWHGHVTAVTVAPAFRRKGLAQVLMKFLEDVTEKTHNGYFVDLFVRGSNSVAISFYKRLGYGIYRTVKKYYSGEEDALDMRKSMKRDPTKECMHTERNIIDPNELEFH